MCEAGKGKLFSAWSVPWKGGGLMPAEVIFGSQHLCKPRGGKEMSKRILSMLLAIVLVVGMMHGMSITANAADVLVTGNWSSNTITYTLYDDYFW